jgi:hypothetical protein
MCSASRSERWCRSDPRAPRSTPYEIGTVGYGPRPFIYGGSVSRGVVLWPDQATEALVQRIYSDLSRIGIPTVASESTAHRPHVSLVVADALNVEAVLAAVGSGPSAPIDLLVESVSIVKARHLLLNITPSTPLLREQSSVHSRVRPHATNSWPHYEPGRWLPHLTLARSLTDEQLRQAIPLVLDYLPLNGALRTGGVEDGTTDDRWVR